MGGFMFKSLEKFLKRKNNTILETNIDKILLNKREVVLLFKLLKNEYYFDTILVLQNMYSYFNKEWTMNHNTATAKTTVTGEDGTDLTPVHSNWHKLTKNDNVHYHRFEINFLSLSGVDHFLNYFTDKQVTPIEKEQFKLMNV